MCPLYLCFGSWQHLLLPPDHVVDVLALDIAPQPVSNALGDKPVQVGAVPLVQVPDGVLVKVIVVGVRDQDDLEPLRKVIDSARGRPESFGTAMPLRLKMERQSESQHVSHSRFFSIAFAYPTGPFAEDRVCDDDCRIHFG